MAVFKPENVEDFYEIGEVLGRYGCDCSESLPAGTGRLVRFEGKRNKAIREDMRPKSV